MGYFVRFIQDEFGRLLHIVRISDEKNTIQYVICGPDNTEELVYVKPK